ncbi:DoxX family protein [Massilia consociata]|uniref:DoxX family protein n=1 Tax=Massilia consociata TaxID=760117 RepID=A0ABV6FGV4_9BURK
MARASKGGFASDDAGKLVLRLALGILILLHGVSKLFGGVSGIAGMLGRHGLPAELAYLVYVGEIVAPLLILVGVMTRLAAWVVAINMVVAILLAHTRELFSLSPTGGWALELQGMFLATSVAVALLGAGRYSMGGAGGRFN